MDKNGREVWVGENRLYLDEDDILNVIMIGEADTKIALGINESYQKILTKFEGKMNIIIDLNKADKGSPEARKVWKKMTENEKTGRVAFFGLHPVARVLASFAMGVSKNKDMRFFKTKEEALAWLKES